MDAAAGAARSRRRTLQGQRLRRPRRCGWEEDPVASPYDRRGIRKRPARSHVGSTPPRTKATPDKNHPVKSRPGPKPRRTKSRIVVPPLPLGSETSASPKDARQERLCEAPSARRTIKGRPAKAPARRAIKDSPKRHPARQKTSGKCTGKYRPAKTGPKDPLARNTRKDPPANHPAGPKIAGKFGVPQQNRYLRTYRTTPAAGQYSRPSDRLSGKATHEKILSVYIGTSRRQRFPLRRSSLYI